MADFSTYKISPAVGVGDGTMLVEWRCRRRKRMQTNKDGSMEPVVVAPGTPADAAPFNMLPVAANWAGGTLFVAVMAPDGTVVTVPVDDLQFDVKHDD